MFAPISNYSLATHEGPYESWPLTTSLLRDGVPTGVSVPGYVIEGQYRWQEHILLINSWDCPFEESCDFVLLDASHIIIARAALGVPYGSFLLHAHWPIDTSSLRLHFYRADCYTLTIAEPTGMFRRKLSLQLRHHLVAPQDERTQRSIRDLREQLDALNAPGNGDA